MLFASGDSFPDLKHILFRELCIRMRFTFYADDGRSGLVSSPSLVPHVPNVVRLGAKSEMRGIHAAPVIARVKHLQTGGNGTICEFPGNTVTDGHSPVPEQLAVSAVRVDRGSPVPTAICLLDVVPETSDGIGTKKLPDAVNGAKPVTSAARPEESAAGRTLGKL